MDAADALIDEIADALKKWHGCHTAILYGSYANGDATSESDIDIGGFSSCAETYRIAGPWRGTYLDAFVYPEDKLTGDRPGLEHLRGGRVLYERDGAGTSLLLALSGDGRQSPISPNEADTRRKWAWKMLARARRGDLEGNFRRVWLLFALLEDALVLRGVEYEGPKAALAWLEASAPDLHKRFARALEPGARLREIEELVELVAGASPNPLDTERLLKSPPAISATLLGKNT